MAFQLLMYAWLYQVRDPFKASIMALKKSAKHSPLIIDNDANLPPQALNEFEDALVAITSEIIDIQKPFSQTNHVKHCEYCDYKHICQRV